MVSNQNFREIELGDKLINIFNEIYLPENNIDTSNSNSIFNVAVKDVEKTYEELNNWIESEPIINRQSLIDILKPILPEFITFDGEYIDLGMRSLNGLIAPRAYLKGADLSGADLSGVYLKGADLSGADLSGVYLKEANLYEADLEGANLSEAYLKRTDLSKVDLTNAIRLTKEQLNGARYRKDFPPVAFNNCPNGKLIQHMQTYD